MMGNTMTFDSDKKEDVDGQIGQALKDVLNKPIDGSLSVKGKVIQSDNGAVNESAASLIGDNLNDVYAEIFFAVSPSLKAGDVFTDTTGLSTPGDSKKFTYTVQSVTAGIATIAFTGSQTLKKEKKVQGMDAVINGQVNFSGSFAVDVKTGVITNKKTTAEGKGTTDVMGQSIPYTLKQDATSTSSK